MIKTAFAFTEELLEAIDIARGDEPRQAWLENRLRKDPIIVQTARDNKIEFGERPQRGKYERTPKGR